MQKIPITYYMFFTCHTTISPVLMLLCTHAVASLWVKMAGEVVPGLYVIVCVNIHKVGGQIISVILSFTTVTSFFVCIFLCVSLWWNYTWPKDFLQLCRNRLVRSRFTKDLYILCNCTSQVPSGPTSLRAQNPLQARIWAQNVFRARRFFWARSMFWAWSQM